MRAHNAISPDVYQKRIEEKCQTSDYTFVRFLPPWKGNKTKFELMCKMHGVFQASVDNFLSLGRKCTKCTNTYRYTQEEREEQLISLCRDTPYTFVKWQSVYKSHKSKAIFHCTIHGEFTTIIADFIRRNTRCSKCAGRYIRTQTEREEQLQRLCQDALFSFVRWKDNYTGDRSKAIFNCVKHGHWIARPDNFIFKGTRCPKCIKTGFNRGKSGTIYFLKSSCGKYLKVGISNDFNRRIKELRRATPFKFLLIYKIEHDGQSVYETEKYFHSAFQSVEFEGFDGCSEWLIYDEKLEFMLKILGA